MRADLCVETLVNAYRTYPFHRMLRKFTKTKTNFPTDDSLKKSIYLSVKEISKKWNNPVRDWGKIIGQFMMFFEERFGEIRTA